MFDVTRVKCWKLASRTHKLLRARCHVLLSKRDREPMCPSPEVKARAGSFSRPSGNNSSRGDRSLGITITPLQTAGVGLRCGAAVAAILQRRVVR